MLKRVLIQFAKSTPTANAANRTAATATKALRAPGLLSLDTRQRKQKLRFQRRRRARRQQVMDTAAAIAQEVEQTTDARDFLLAQLTNQVFSRGHTFHSSACNITYVPDGNPATPEIAFVGRAEVGKTSLLRSLFRESRTVGRSNTKQRTDAMNFFSVGGGIFNIVDLPGLGGTQIAWTQMLQNAILLRNFVRCRPNLKMLYYCMDVHFMGGVAIPDLDLLSFMTKEIPNFTILITKGDALLSSSDPQYRNQNGVRKNSYRDDGAQEKESSSLVTIQDVKEELLRNGIEHPVLVTSAYHMGGIDALRFDMIANVCHSLPTEKLTIAEAKRLSERLMTQSEIASVRPLSIAPTELHVEQAAWAREIDAEEAKVAQLERQETTTSKVASPSSTTTVSSQQQDNNNNPPAAPATDHRSNSMDGAANRRDAIDVATPSPSSPSPPPSVVGFVNPLSPYANRHGLLPYDTLVKKLHNTSLLQYVHETSPWRNPILWPANVIPTKHPRINIMRCPEDPHNPYLTQAHFVAPRMDMYFRRPNVGRRRSGMKGKYLSETTTYDKALAGLTTIPCFPDIVDVEMHPRPWMFLGSTARYYERNQGRQLGIRLTREATEGLINPLADRPTSVKMPLLGDEVKRLEAERYENGKGARGALPHGTTSAPIAHLKPR